MCRIAGFAYQGDREERGSILSSMTSSLAHGGPDDEGIYLDDRIGFGHRRLSILDLSAAGHQPMLSKEEDLVITYNGEIYNFQELRTQLQTCGKIFQTQTDTEVILAAYEQWGLDAFDMFEGIFAFALYDRRKREVLLVRDHVGVKPLYYSVVSQQLVFASEVRAFKKFNAQWPENPDWKILFLAFGSMPEPATTLQDVYSLPPGHCLTFPLDHFSPRVQDYRKKTDQSGTSPEMLELMRNTLRASVRKNLISDAPIGIFLSGGIDSSLITLLADQMQEAIKTISVNFDEASFDEHFFQQKVLEKTRNAEHISHRVSEHMFWDKLPDIWRAMDQPSIDGVNTYFISACARRDGLKAVLSGLGADEIFGGYASFQPVRYLSVLRGLPMKRMFADLLGQRNSAFRRLVFLDLPGAAGDYLLLRGIHTPDVIAGILNIREEAVWEVLRKISIELPQTTHEREYMSQLESRIYMTNQLLRDTDTMAMWHGVEVRVPFLDISLLKIVEKIAVDERYKKGYTKYLVSEPYRDLLPPEVVNRSKKGFTFPISLWMKRNPQAFKELIEPVKEAEKIVKGFAEGRDHWSRYWSLVVMKQFGGAG